jgi:tripartite-type tricarboxylate transporter receptor subunit TctC
METTRRNLLQVTAGACLLQSTARAFAGSFPDRPIKAVVPFSPGGNSDVVGRVLGARMSQTLGQSLIVDNRPGAGGAIGAESVARAAPDGYTLLVGTNGPLTVSPVLQEKLRYDVFKDFLPIALAGVVPHALVVNNALPAKTLADLLTLARSKPLSVATSGVGSSTHLTLARLNAEAGLKLQHIPYRGGNTPVGDLIGGALDGVIMELSAALPLHQAGKARLVAIASSTRSRIVSEVRTLIEDGIRNCEASSYVGMLVPANTPATTVARLQRAAAEALTHPTVLDKLIPIGFEVSTPTQQTPAGFAGHLRAEYDRAAQIVRMAGIKLE